jgi:LysR family glycine cleavage system transcriptional activator
MHAALLRQLHVFCVAARHESFKVAADLLCLTPSAVSHQVRGLERTLGVTLFERRVRAVVLTAAGRSLRTELEPQLARIEQIVSRTRRHGGRPSIRVAIPPFFASELFVPRLRSFYALQPDVDLELSTDEPPRDHVSGIDVSIVVSDRAPDRFPHHRLFSLQLVAVASRGLAQVVRDQMASMVRHYPLVVHRERRDAWTRWARAHSIDRGEPGRFIEVDSWIAAVRAAEQGLGVALVPAALCQRRFRRGSLTLLSPISVAMPEVYYVVHRTEDRSRPEVRALVTWALTEFRSESGSSAA